MKNLIYALAASAVLTAACGAPVKQSAGYGADQYYSQTPEALQEKGKPVPSVQDEAALPDAPVAAPKSPELAAVAPASAVVAPAPAQEAAPVPSEPAAAVISSHTAQGSLEIEAVTLSSGSVKVTAKVGNSTNKFWKRKWGYGFRFKFFDPSDKLVSLTKKVTLVDRDIPEGKAETVKFALKIPVEIASKGGSIRIALVTEGSEIAAVSVPLKVEKPAAEPEPLPEEESSVSISTK